MGNSSMKMKNGKDKGESDRPSLSGSAARKPNTTQSSSGTASSSHRAVQGVQH